MGDQQGAKKGVKKLHNRVGITNIVDVVSAAILTHPYIINEIESFHLPSVSR